MRPPAPLFFKTVPKTLLLALGLSLLAHAMLLAWSKNAPPVSPAHEKGNPLLASLRKSGVDEENPAEQGEKRAAGETEEKAQAEDTLPPAQVLARDFPVISPGFPPSPRPPEMPEPSASHAEPETLPQNPSPPFAETGYPAERPEGGKAANPTSPTGGRGGEGQGDPEGVKDAIRLYTFALTHAAKRYMHYPVQAREQGQEGRVWVRLSVRSGLAKVTLRESSGYFLLDEAAVRLLLQAVHHTEIPEGLKNRSFDHDFPLEYFLLDAH